MRCRPSTLTAGRAWANGSQEWLPLHKGPSCNDGVNFRSSSGNRQPVIVIYETMIDPNEQYAYFTLVGEFDPADISLQAGTPPTECWIKGSRNERTHLERKFSRWSLFSRLDRTCDIEAHIRDVIDQLRANRKGFIDLASKYGGTMQLVAKFNNDYPGYHFNRELVESLAEFKLEIDFDLYWMYSDSREDSR